MPKFLKNEKTLAAILIAIGILLRLQHYFENRSFWLDEAYMALDITVRSFQQILSGVVFSPDLPAPPVGFALIEKFFIETFGNNEYILRLFPLAAGIVSLPLFYLFLKQCASPQSRLLALGLFAVLDPLIYYAAELKPYSSDVLWALIIYLAAFKQPSQWLFGLIGAGAIFCSYPAVFILAGIAVAQKPKRPLSYTFWLASFLIHYFLAVGPLAHNNVLAADARAMGYLPPAGLVSTDGIKWFLTRLTGIFSNPVEIFPPILGAGFFLFGAGKLWAADRQKLFYLILPIMFVLGAIVGEKYIFAGRLLLFCVPILVLLITEGAIRLVDRLRKFRTACTVLLLFTLFFPSAVKAAYYLQHPRKQSEIRPVVEYLKKYAKESDAIYYNNSAQYGVGYYSGYFGLPCPFFAMGKISDEVKGDIELQYDRLQCSGSGYFCGAAQAEQLLHLDAGNIREHLSSSRNWVLLSHIGEDDKQKILEILRAGSKEVQSFEAVGAGVYLFDFSKD